VVTTPTLDRQRFRPARFVAMKVAMGNPMQARSTAEHLG
jgi:hypothetical protein